MKSSQSLIAQKIDQLKNFQIGTWKTLCVKFYTQFCRKQLLSQIYALSNVKFLGLKLQLCKKLTNIRHRVTRPKISSETKTETDTETFFATDTVTFFRPNFSRPSLRRFFWDQGKDPAGNLEITLLFINSMLEKPCLKFPKIPPPPLRHFS